MALLGDTFDVGSREVVELVFDVIGNVRATKIAFGDEPIRNQVADGDANPLGALFDDLEIVFPGADIGVGQLLGITVDEDGVVELHWEAGAGDDFRLERSLDLDQWEVVTVVNAGEAGGTQRYKDAEGGADKTSQRFYRVRLVEPVGGEALE